mmetsp:Transcript_44219/g.84956  ORF Transcript_44219/g.84956 Transcript_44219/m.84956 type:complete len:306 (+) Transcript_44219:65-982(+)
MEWDTIGTPMDLVLPLLGPLPLQLGGALAPAATAAPCLVDMATAALRHAPLVVLVVLQLYAVGAGGADAATDAAADAEERCSKTLGFNETLVPKDRSSQDLVFCNEHHKRTCCEKNNTRQVLTAWTAFAHDRSVGCSQMSRLALCATCDGDVGSGLKARKNLVLLCPSFCSRWFQSCLADFFAPSGSGRLQPCGPGSLVCSPLREVTEESAEFCSKIGDFAVSSQEEEPDSCFDGVPAAKSRGKGPRAVWARPTPRLKPWWRRILDGQLPPELQRLKYQLQGYVPGAIVAFVAVLFGWYIYRDAD